MTWFRIITLLAVTCAAGIGTLQSQELDARVTVNMEPIQMDQRMEARTMAADVERYLNNQRYTGQDWEGERIPVDVTIYLMSRSGNRYVGRLGVVSRRLANGEPGTGGPLLRIFDQEWTFEWSFNPVLNYQTMRYDPFTSVIDFYMLMVIGMDMDTYDDLGGTTMYNAAKQIAQLGSAMGISSFSTTYQPGEITRMSLITELTDPRYNGLRRLLYDYHGVMDEYAVDPEKGRQQMLVVLDDLAYFKQQSISNRSAVLDVLFDAKAGELADMFRGMKDAKVWDTLRFLDPSNSQMYESAAQGK